MLNKLYNPNKSYTLIEDFKDLKPQLVHLFIRSAEKFKPELEQKIMDTIISERTQKSEKDELTKEELEEFEKRKHLLEKKIDFSIVNHYFESGNISYTDPSGIRSYISDTSNQISTTYFDIVNFINECNG